MNTEDMEAEISLYYNEIDYYVEYYYNLKLIKEFNETLQFYGYMLISNLFNREEMNITRNKLKSMIRRCKLIYNSFIF